MTPTPQHIISGSGWIVTVDQQMIDVTSMYPSPRETWVYDAEGHRHGYDKGYPSLVEVVDAQHWCDGTEGWFGHDPHLAVDRSHYECAQCRERIEPAMDPPGTTKFVPGEMSVSFVRFRSIASGMYVTTEQSEGYLTPEEWGIMKDQMRAVAPRDRSAVDQVVCSFLDGLPADRRARSQAPPLGSTCLS